MTIAYSPYQLFWKHAPNKHREGALLRVTFDDGCVGYCDCFCWHEFGDDPLDVQLELLAKGVTTPLTKRGMVYARLDADARRRKEHLFAGLEFPKSHRLISDLASWNQPCDQGVYKIKVGENPIEEALLFKSLAINSPKALFRLDFNGKISKDEYETFIATIASYKRQIDFVEDPYPFDAHAWKETQAKTKVSLACDRGAERALGLPEVAQVIIVKPAKQDEKMLQGKGQRAVITSYLDHPLGQLAAAYFVAKSGSKEAAGLLSHLAYVDNPYSSRLGIAGNRLQFDLKGTGFGFDDLLAKEEWKAL